jgi:LysM repeat protein
MHDPKAHASLLIGVCACLLLSGCFQGYGENVGSQEELDALLISLTPVSQPIASPIMQATIPIAQPTGVPTLPLVTLTNTPIVMEGGVIIHIVKVGDTLFNIAQTYGVTVEALSAMNHITDPNSLFIEQALIIPNAIPLPQNPIEESTQTSHLPTDTATSLPPNTLIPTNTPTVPYTAMPSATTVTLVTQTPSPTLETQLNASTQKIHVVETGQTLFQISQTYDISLDNLADVNDIDDPSQVTIGQKLRIPLRVISDPQAEAMILDISTQTPPSDNAVDSSGATVHVVSAGETLFQIALDYSISLDALAQANNINDTSQLLAEQELLIPGATPMAVIDVSAIALQSQVSSPQQRITLDSPTQINGVPLSNIVYIPPQVETNIISIYQQGQELGRNARAFSKLGDSTIENPHFLTRFDHWQGFDYNLGDYVYLESVITYFAGSFIREGAAVQRGMHSWTVFDPQWADKSICNPNESSLACEFRLHNPSILLVRLGANDVGVPQAFENNLRDVIEFCIENGVIPVLGTKADRNDGASNANNQIIRRLAEDYQLPLWDFDRLADTLPRRGLTTDNVHMTINFSHDYTDPSTFRTGHGMHNLSALILLDNLWQVLSSDVDRIEP